MNSAGQALAGPTSGHVIPVTVGRLDAYPSVGGTSGHVRAISWPWVVEPRLRTLLVMNHEPEGLCPPAGRFQFMHDLLAVAAQHGEKAAHVDPAPPVQAADVEGECDQQEDGYRASDCPAVLGEPAWWLTHRNKQLIIAVDGSQVACVDHLDNERGGAER